MPSKDDAQYKKQRFMLHKKFAVMLCPGQATRADHQRLGKVRLPKILELRWPIIPENWPLPCSFLCMPKLPFVQGNLPQGNFSSPVTKIWDLLVTKLRTLPFAVLGDGKAPNLKVK
jgi:hypothetical protein